MGKGNAGSIVLWVIAGFFLLGSFSFLPTGEIGPFFTGLVIAAALAFWGWRKFKKNVRNTPPSASTFAPPQSTPQSAMPYTPPGAAPQPQRQTQIEATAFFGRTHSFKVAGVTFNNADSESRQSILHNIITGAHPFNKGYDVAVESAAEVGMSDYTENGFVNSCLNVDLAPYQYEGKPAIYVLVNGKIVGNVPAKDVDFVNKNLSKIVNEKTSIFVYGGNEKNYGAEVLLQISYE